MSLGSVSVALLSSSHNATTNEEGNELHTARQSSLERPLMKTEAVSKETGQWRCSTINVTEQCCAVTVIG